MKKENLITDERYKQGDLTVRVSASGHITHAQTVDRSLLALLIARDILNLDHEYAGRRYRNVRDTYLSYFYRSNRRQGVSHNDRTLGDDYLYLCRRLTPKQKRQIEYVLVPQPFPDYEVSQALKAAYDRLIALFLEVDDLWAGKETEHFHDGH